MNPNPVYHSILSTEGVLQAVQAHYDLGSDFNCNFLKQGINDIYLLESQEKKYIFRISRHSRIVAYSQESYQFELNLLNYLIEYGIQVSGPVRSTSGTYLGSLELMEGKRYYALFEYVEGCVHYPENPKEAYKVGETLAKFHMATAEYPGLIPDRLTHDFNFLIDQPIELLTKQNGILGQEDLSFLRNTADEMKKALLPMISECSQGIIHGDFWWHNYHVQDRQIVMFDFDFSGLGWYAYDLASFFGTAKGLNYELSDDIKQSFLNGYNSIRPLNQAEISSIEYLSLVRVIWGLGLWTTLIPMNGKLWFKQSVDAGIAQLKRIKN